MSDSDVVSRLNAPLEGRYRVERELGEGGMATVYLADDLRHDRKVALKVLRPELAAVVGAERFLAEIKTTARLQHPHILPLHDSGEASGFLYYVMPYVEGESLRDRLDRERQLPVDEAIRIATNVAEALAYAHRSGVIHRDIKPANVLLVEGKPVISDFGIALALGAAGGGRLTETGLSLGTPHYMSPEQATGDQSVGAATDVYALGCVLYEMLVGEPPFTGSTAQAVLGKIIQAEPVSATKARRSVPTNVDAAIRKALEKLAADRFPGAEEFASALADPGFRYGVDAASGPRAAGGRIWKPLPIAATALVVLSTAVASWVLLRPGPRVPPRPVSRHVISAPPAAPVVTTGTYVDVAMSPDGQSIVYQSSLAPFELSVRSLERLESVTLRGPDAALGPFLSPDGQWVAFQAGPAGPLQRVSILGGPPLTICTLPADLESGSWGLDGTIVFSVNSPDGLREVPFEGGEPRLITIPDGGAHNLPDVLPNGAGVVFVDSSAPGVLDDRIAVLDRRTGEHRVIVQAGTSPRYASSGHIVYVLGNTLMAVAFDADRLEVTSDPVPVLEGVMTKANGAASFSLSETGSLVYVTGAALGRVRTAVWVGRDGGRVPLPLPPRPYQDPRLSPNGRRLAVGVAEEGAAGALWVYDVDSPAGLRLTPRGGFDPVWTSNGRVAFSSYVGGRYQIHTVASDRSSGPELLFANEGVVGDFPTSVTPDGRYLIFTRLLSPDRAEILQASLQGDRPPERLVQGEFSRGNGNVSPDGRWLAYQSREPGRRELYVQPYPGPGPTVPVSTGGGSSVAWSLAGDELFYRLEDRMIAVPFDAEGETPRIGPPTELFRGAYYTQGPGGTRQYDVAPDGRFLMLEDASGESSGDELQPQVVLVQNWFEELRERVPN